MRSPVEGGELAMVCCRHRTPFILGLGVLLHELGESGVLRPGPPKNPPLPRPLTSRRGRFAVLHEAL